MTDNKLEELINNIKDKNASKVESVTKDILNDKKEQVLADKKIEIAKDLLNK